MVFESIEFDLLETWLFSEANRKLPERKTSTALVKNSLENILFPFKDIVRFAFIFASPACDLVAVFRRALLSFAFMPAPNLAQPPLIM
jgi:hypothetical protein